MIEDQINMVNKRELEMPQMFLLYAKCRVEEWIRWNNGARIVVWKLLTVFNCLLLVFKDVFSAAEKLEPANDWEAAAAKSVIWAESV